LVYSGKNNRHSLGALTRLFSTPFASLACILLACVGRCVHLLSTFSLQTDKGFQLQAAKNFYLGHGISIYEAGAADISQVVYQPLIKWPPAYSLLAAPFNALGENNYLSGIIIIDVFACILFVVAARKIFQLSDAPLWQINIYTLVSGFAFYHFAMGASTDLLCLAFFLSGTYFSLKLLKQPAPRKGLAVVAVVLLWLSGFTRFLAVPLALLIPVYISLQAKLKRDSRFVRLALSMFAALALLFIFQFLLQKLVAGASVYLYPVEKGFFPSHLMDTGPFLFEAAGNLEPAALAADSYSILSFEKSQHIIVVSHLVLIAVLGVASVIWLVGRQYRAAEARDHFLILSILLSLLTLAILGFLSLTNGRIGDPDRGWTYVSELRYFSAAIFFVQLCIFSGALRKHTSRLLNILLKCLLAVMILSALHGFIFTTKTIIQDGIRIPMNSELKELDQGMDLIRQVEKANPNIPIICISNEPVFLNYASIKEDKPGIYLGASPPSYHTSQPVLIFVAVKRNFGMEQLKTLAGIPPIGETANWKFFLHRAYPDSAR
jgi:hypothetical protein